MGQLILFLFVFRKCIVLTMIFLMLLNWKGLVLKSTVSDSEKIKTPFYFSSITRFFFLIWLVQRCLRNESKDRTVSVHRTVKFRFGSFYCFIIFSLFFDHSFIFFYCGCMQHFNIFKENNFHLFRYLLDETPYYASLFARRTVSFLT